MHTQKLRGTEEGENKKMELEQVILDLTKVDGCTKSEEIIISENKHATRR